MQYTLTTTYLGVQIHIKKIKNTSELFGITPSSEVFFCFIILFPRYQHR